MPPKNDPYQVITERTFAVPLVPTIVLVSSVLVGSVSVVFWVTQTLGEIRSTLRDATKDRWTASHQREFTHELQSGNPTLKVPDTDSIKKRIDSDR